MKYFIPELIVMGQSNDDHVLTEQDRLWEQAGDRYVAYLDGVRPHFPPGLRQIDQRYYLHDAIIHGMGRRDQFFVIILQLDTPPQSILTFTYDLVDDPLIVKGALPPEACGTGPMVAWQYNEIEIVPGPPPTWRESLLLSNGWELTLHFRDVQVEEAQAVLPAPRNGAAAGVAFVQQPTVQG
jgi:hypothetical protein